MAQIPFRANTQSMSFPLLSELSGRTIVVPGADQTFVPGLSISVDQTQVPVDRGAPQLYYCHNVMPSTYGYQSVGYDIAYQGIDWGSVTPTSLEFKSMQLIQAGQISGADLPLPTGYRTYISNPKSGSDAVFVLDPASKKWKPVNGAPVLAADTRISVATVNGVSYIFFSKIGAYIYNNFTNTLIPRTLSGLDISTILGVVSSNGYLFAYSANAVAWSSVTNVEDFVPSDVSGAGGGSIQEAKGDIVTAATTALGLILYTKLNAVSCIYSGNADFPWNFKEVPSSGGISDPDLVSAQQTGGFQQVYSTNGLQQVAHNGARTVYPQLTDFLAGNMFEDFDTATNKMKVFTFDWVMEKGLAVVADRYVILSYGMMPGQEMTHALVMDITQSRLGKLKIPHSFCFELRKLLSEVVETPRGSLAFLQSDGTIKTVNFNYTQDAPDSVILLGKFQYVRQRMLELFSVELENVKAGADFAIRALPSLDGKNFNGAVNSYLLEAAENFRHYTFEGVVGTNVSLIMTGRFNLNLVLLWFAAHGRK